MPVGQAVGLDGVKYDIRKFSYIGNTTDSPNVINSWHSTGVTKIEQVMEKEFVVGATGRSSGSYYYPAALNAFAGTKFKIVFGYPGGADVNIAMERGEVGGRGSNLWASWKSTRPQWLAEKKIHMLVQIALKRHPELPDVPLMQELVKNELHKQVLVFISADTGIARSIVTAPDVPADRVAAAAAGVRCRHEGSGADQGSRAGPAGHQPDLRRRGAGDRQFHRRYQPGGRRQGEEIIARAAEGMRKIAIRHPEVLGRRPSLEGRRSRPIILRGSLRARLRMTDREATPPPAPAPSSGSARRCPGLTNALISALAASACLALAPMPAA